MAFPWLDLPERHAEPSRGFARSELKTVHRTVFRAPFTLHRQACLDRVRRVNHFASHLIPRIKCFCSNPDCFLILLTAVIRLRAGATACVDIATLTAIASLSVRDLCVI